MSLINHNKCILWLSYMSRPLFALRQSSPLASRPSAARRQGPSSPPKLESIVIFVAKQPREARETASINYITSRFLANSRFEGEVFSFCLDKCAGLMFRMSHWIWKGIKQQTSRNARNRLIHLPSCCLVSLRYQCDIRNTNTIWSPLQPQITTRMELKSPNLHALCLSNQTRRCR